MFYLQVQVEGEVQLCIHVQKAVYLQQQLGVVRCRVRIASEGKVEAEELARQLQEELTQLQQQLASQSLTLTDTTTSVSC